MQAFSIYNEPFGSVNSKPTSKENEVEGIPKEIGLLKARDVSKILKVSPSLVYRMARRGQIKSVRWPCLGKGTRKRMTLRFRKSDLLDFVKDHMSKE